VDAVVITHAHLDHSGYLPLLVRNGFNGAAYCTPETAELAELATIILRDSAHIAESDAAHADGLGYSKPKPTLPRYDSAHAEKAIEPLTTVEHDIPTTIAGEIGLELRPAGHILGSAYAELDVGGSRLLVSGDVGRPDHALLLPPETPAMPTRWSWSRRTVTGCTRWKTTSCWPTPSPARSAGVVSS
jgi:metallo-beta-lactamase family protein